MINGTLFHLRPSRIAQFSGRLRTASTKTIALQRVPEFRFRYASVEFDFTCISIANYSVY